MFTLFIYYLSILSYVLNSNESLYEVTLLIVNRESPDPDDLRKFMFSPEGMIRQVHVEGDLYKPELFQTAFLNHVGNSITNKSRQIGFSFNAAAKSLIRSLLIKQKTSIFISINLEEAQEKIRYLNMFDDGLPLKWRRKRIIDNRREVEWEDGSRVISHPSRAVRGKAKTDIYFDEFAHVQDDVKIYIGTTASVIRGGGNIDIGSSPFGTRGIFYEIYTEIYKKYPNYAKFIIPWWSSRYLCVNLVEAARLAPYMTTEERVEIFGTESLKAQFDLLSEEAFQQEFECAFLDETSSMFPVQLILDNTDHLLECTKVEIKNPKTDAEKEVAKNKILAAIGELSQNVVGTGLYAGYDVGRKKDSSELILYEKFGDRRVTRLMFTLNKCEFPLQEFLLKELVKIPRMGRCCIDTNGIGMQLAEGMVEEFPGNFEAVNFTLQNKEFMATALLKTLQQRNWHLPPDRDLQIQLNSIKRVITPSGNIRYDVEKNSKHHGDKAWALALACIADSELALSVGGVSFGQKPVDASKVHEVGQHDSKEVERQIREWQERKIAELSGDLDE